MSSTTTNNTLCPFARIAAMLVVGIVAGDAIGRPSDASAILYAAVAVTAIAIVLHMRVGRGTAVSVLTLAGIAFMGAWRTTTWKSGIEVTLTQKEESYEAVVASQPVEKNSTIQCEMIVTKGRLAGQRINAYIQKNPNPYGTIAHNLHIGDGIRTTSRIDSAAWNNRTTALPHFDYTRWLRIHGIVARTYIAATSWRMCRTSLKTLSTTQRMRLNMLRIRDRMLHRLHLLQMPQTTYAVVTAMTMGDRSVLTREIRQTYTTSGASHILALSGLHLGIIYGIFSMLFIRRRNRIVGQSLAITAIWAYAMLVGLPPSVVRAATMISIYALASAASRRPAPLNTLAIAATALLAANPASLWDIGFQMSFMAVGGILLCNECLRDIPSAHIAATWRPFGWVWSMIKVSLSAQIAVAPLAAYYFGTFPCYFLITNLIAIPLATLTIWCTLLIITTPFAPWLQGVAAKATNWLMTAMNSALTWVSNLPGAYIDNIRINLVQLAAIYTLMGLCIALLLYTKQMWMSSRGTFLP